MSVPARPKRESVTATKVANPTPAELASRYELVALVLQGGGALGAYQCGVYEALHEFGIQPTWFAGTSIGAINAAILAGNAPEDRVARLREFWDTICVPAGVSAWPATSLYEAWAAWMPPSETLSSAMAALGAMGALAHGQRGFFTPRMFSPFAYQQGTPEATSFYDTTPLRATLERLIDFDRINGGEVRLSVGAANVRSGNVRYFDSKIDRITAEHIIASGALPPAFPAVVIDGESYWDGGTVSNTPLDYVLSEQPRRDSLVLQVDLWSARGALPATLMDVFERQKDIQYSSRTRYGTDVIARLQRLRAALAQLAKTLPGGKLPESVEADLQPWMCDRVFNIVHLIHQTASYEQQYKDFAFDSGSIHKHWQSGSSDMRNSLEHPHYLALPSRDKGMVTHDIHRARIEAE